MTGAKARSYLYIPHLQVPTVLVCNTSHLTLPVFTQCQASLTRSLSCTYTLVAQPRTRRALVCFVACGSAASKKKKRFAIAQNRRERRTTRPAVPCSYRLASLSRYFLVVALRC
ncbi:hypothetical protein HDV63DRAFT_227815 [Trichoderma sp. SZMC 28014]